KCNKDWFPTLFVMAQNFLSIPATSIASEQAFSCTGHIIDDSRTLLDPDMVTALMYQRNWLEVSEKF
ncbi:33308_t:CDS:1, partial [Gigaspora margarita]